MPVSSSLARIRIDIRSPWSAPAARYPSMMPVSMVLLPGRQHKAVAYQLPDPAEADAVLQAITLSRHAIGPGSQHSAMCNVDDEEPDR